MTDRSEARENMIEGQVRTNDVTDSRIIDVMGRLPRESFVPKSKQSLAYMGKNLEIRDGRYLMGPRAFSKLAQEAKVQETDLVLVIGCGAGYATAVLAEIADSVVAVESDETLAEQASARLSELGIDNVAVITGPLPNGLPDQGPYDVIFFDGAIPERCAAIEDQLKEGGRMVAIIQEGPVGRAHLIERVSGRMTELTCFDASVPNLPGFEKEREFVF